MPAYKKWVPMLLGGVIVSLALGSALMVTDESVFPASLRSTSATRVYPGGSDGGSPALPAERELQITRRIGGPNTFGFPVEIHAAAESLYVIDAQPLVGDERVLVVDRATGQVLHRVAPEGEGPGDIMASLSLHTVPGPSPSLSIFDYLRGRVTLYHIDPWQDEPAGFLVRGDASPQGRSLLWISNTRAVMNGPTVDHLLRFYEREEAESDVVASQLQFTAEAGVSMFPDLSQHAQAELNGNQIAVRPDGKLVAAAFFNASRLAIFDSDGHEIAVARGPDVQTWVLPNGERDRRLAEMAYRDVAASQERVYGLFVGYAEGGNDPATIIHVYTWEGTLVDVLRLVEGVYFIDVDTVSGRLYGTTLDPYPLILEYDPRQPS